MQNVHFTPPEIARLIGVNESTVKRWVDKGLLTAEVTPGGHRRVSKRDIEKFIQAHRKGADRSYILKKLNATSDSLDYEPYYLNLLSRRYREAQQLLHQAYISGVAIADIIEQIIVPTLVRIGRGWKEGVLSIQSEHRITIVIREQLIALQQFTEGDTLRKKGKVLISCVPGDNHELVLHILALALKSYKYETEVLGINISIKELARATKEYRPDHIVLSKVYSAVRMSTEYVNGLAQIMKVYNTSVHIGGSGWKKGEIAHIVKQVPYAYESRTLKELEKIHLCKVQK